MRVDHTEDVIAEAERTRAELGRLTKELVKYTADLRARVGQELQHDGERVVSRGGTEASGSCARRRRAEADRVRRSPGGSDEPERP
jgi:hypothetical protein